MGGRFFDDKKPSNLDELKLELASAIEQAKTDPTSMRHFVHTLALVMSETMQNEVSDKQINYATSVLLNSLEITHLKTGEGKIAGNMLLYAAQALLGRENNVMYLNDSLLKRDAQDFKGFLSAVGLELKLDETTSHSSNVPNQS